MLDSWVLKPRVRRLPVLTCQAIAFHLSSQLAINCPSRDNAILPISWSSPSNSLPFFKTYRRSIPSAMSSPYVCRPSGTTATAGHHQDYQTHKLAGVELRVMRCAASESSSFWWRGCASAYKLGSERTKISLFGLWWSDFLDDRIFSTSHFTGSQWFRS
jgi:hypothetical protein